MIRTRNLLISLLLLLLSGCTTQEKYDDGFLKIAVSNWVGYTPLLYAYEKGRLEGLDIKIVPTTSVAVSENFIKRGVVDAFMATQWEYKGMQESVEPVLIIDKSYGGDKILANISKEELFAQKYPVIDVQMEVESINYLLYKYLIDTYIWDKTTFHIQNNTQAYIASAHFKNPTLLITYEPYASKLLQQGYYEIESSKNPDIMIIDGLFVKKKMLPRYKEKLQVLHNEIDFALHALKKNPKKYYETIEYYLEGQTYDEFIKSLKNIQWLNKDDKSFVKEYGHIKL